MVDLYSCSCGDAAYLCRSTRQLSPDLGPDMVNIINSYKCRSKCKGCLPQNGKEEQASRQQDIEPNKSSKGERRKGKESNKRHKKRDGWEQKGDWHEGLSWEHSAADGPSRPSICDAHVTWDRGEVEIDPLEARRNSSRLSSDGSSPSL